jgi:hypothetical protein
MVKFGDSLEEKMYFIEITMAVYATLFCAAVFAIIGETANDLKNTDFMYNCLNVVMAMGFSIFILMAILILRILFSLYVDDKNKTTVRKRIFLPWLIAIIFCGILIILSSFKFVFGLSKTLATPIEPVNFVLNLTPWELHTPPREDATPRQPSLRRAVALPEAEELAKTLRRYAEEVRQSQQEAQRLNKEARRLNEETRQTAEQIRVAAEEVRAAADEQRQLLRKMLDTVPR